MRPDSSPFGVWFERMPPPDYARLLEGLAEIVGSASTSSDDPFTAVAEADAIIASSRLRYDADLMDRAPRLRVISRTGMGLDNISLEAATARKIAVCNVPNGPTISTAEHAFALVMATAKRLKHCEQALRAGHHDYFSDYDGIELHGLSLGLVGLGQIGGRVAGFALALGMHVLAFDPFIESDRAAVLGVELTPTLESLLEASDIVSLHAPLTHETHRLIDAGRLAQMKPGAILINTARGSLVDEQALLDALEHGQLAGAGLDVFDPEPPEVTNKLLWRDDVIATPHVAGATGASKDRLWRDAITQALQVLRGERPPYLVNAEIWATEELAPS